MSYGTNAPFGLQATRSLGASTWNGQTNPYLIQSQYGNNIFKGDPVVIAGATDIPGGPGAGYIISIYDVAGHGYTAAATVGIFDGCSYVSPTVNNPIDPASPGRQFWAANTPTLNGHPAVAYIIDDPNTIFNVQGGINGGNGITQANVGAGYSYAFSLIGTTNTVNGNTQNGTSQVGLQNAPIRGTANNVNVMVTRLVPSPPNPSPTTIGGGVPYNNAEVLIWNHQYCQRALPRT